MQESCQRIGPFLRGDGCGKRRRPRQTNLIKVNVYLYFMFYYQLFAIYNLPQLECLHWMFGAKYYNSFEAITVYHFFLQERQALDKIYTRVLIKLRETL